MPIQELINFRTKYPQYEDLSDSDLADKLAVRFPDDYSDLPGLVANEAPEEKPSFRSEIMGPITHAASALAFDVPRTTMKMQAARGEPGAEQAKKFLYPEQKTLPGKMLRFGLEAPATVVGGASRLAGAAFKKVGAKLGIEAAKGAVKKAPTFLGKASLLGKQTVQGAASGATFGAATTAPTPEEYLKNIEANTKFGAAIPAGLTGAGAVAGTVGKGLTKTGHFISEQFGGVTKATRDTIARLGAERVFEPIKSTANYVGQVLVPKAQAKLSNSINKFTKNVEDVAVNQFKVPPSVVSDIKSFGTKTIRQTSEANANSTQGIVTKIQQAMDVKEEAAHKAYREAIGSFKGRDIVVDSFYRNIQSSLRTKGWVDLRGNPTGRYKSGLNTTYDKLTDLYRDMKTQTSKGKEISGRLLSKEDFSTYRDVLMDMIKERPSDLVIHKARYALYDAADASGMKGLKAARDAERTVFEANRRFQTTSGELKSILQEPTLERFYKLPQQKIKALKDLEKYTGTKIIDDIRQINAAKYLRDLEKKLLDPSGLEKDLHATGNPKASILKDAYSKLLGKNIMDDLDAHFANRDFRLVTDVPGTGGTIYPSRAGFIRSGISGAARKYYKDIKPAFIRGKEKLEGVGKKVGQYYQAPLGLSKQGQSLLKGEKGFASFGGDVYQGEKDITTKVLRKLEGRSTVSKQFISDLTNQPELKQAERELIRQVLNESGDTVLVKEFANKVKVQLLPLKVKVMNERAKYKTGIAPKSKNYARYENRSLLPEERGPIQDYFERIYESPIKTSAGGVHFGSYATVQADGPKGYFAHTRIEDLPRGKVALDPKYSEYAKQFTEAGQKKFMKPFSEHIYSKGTTRRIIELQSDLFQKGGLGREGIGKITMNRIESRVNDLRPGHDFDSNKVIPLSRVAIDKVKGIFLDEFRSEHVSRIEKAIEDVLKLHPEESSEVNRVFEIIRAELVSSKKLETKLSLRNRELMKLEPYENTWHERIIREEIKQASKDGKTKLQFPTGETAMKIEGLGLSEDRWFFSDGSRDTILPHNLKVGFQIQDVADEKWIITDVLGEGKFRAIPKAQLDKKVSMGYKNPDMEQWKETFDISGKIDTSNPIYRFYEKEVARYLKRVAPDTKLITDKQGVTWYQMEVPKAAKDRPIEAFAVGGAPVLLAPRKKQEQGSKIEGEASTYGWEEELNKDTFSGEEFNPDGITVAMRNVPMGTKVKITDQKTGKTVTAVVNDGGPAEKTKRVVDLSKGAWKALGYSKAGLTQVSVEILEECKGKSYPRSKPSLIKSRQK